MMRNGVCGVVACSALAVLLGLPAANADAVQPKVVLTARGEPGVPWVGTIAVGVQIGDEGVGEQARCVAVSRTTEWKNDRPVITPRLPPFSSACRNDAFEKVTDYAISGRIRSASLPWSGEARVVGNLILAKPGPCRYTYRRLSFPNVTFSESFTGASGETEGNLIEGSKITCPLTDREPVELVFYQVTESEIGLMGSELQI
jgi:hypothetical protein